MGKLKENKRYFWIQLTQDFFKSKEMKLLRKMPGGDTYTIIYQKMLLVSLEDGGKIYYDDLADDLAEEVSLLIDEDIEAVRMTLLFLENKGLLKRNSEKEYFLEQVPEMVGSETASTRRSRKHREQKALQCNTNATLGNGDIDKEIELKKDIESELDKTPPPPKSNLNFGQFVRAEGLKVNDNHIQRLLDYIGLDGMNMDLVKLAVTRTTEQGIVAPAYTFSILDNWKKKGFTTVEQANKEQEEFEQQKSKTSPTTPQKTNVPEWSNPDYRAPDLDSLKVEVTEDYSDDPTAF